MSTDLLARADSSVANEVATYMKSTNNQQNALRSAQNRDQVSPFEFQVNLYCASSKISPFKATILQRILENSLSKFTLQRKAFQMRG